jgi:hypothetical protein
MPWDTTKKHWWLDGVSSADRTKSGGGIIKLSPLYPLRITPKIEGWVFGAGTDALHDTADYRYGKKKGSQTAWEFTLTSAWEPYQGSRVRFRISNGKPGEAERFVEARVEPLNFDEMGELCDHELPKLRSNAHLLPPQISLVLALMTYNTHSRGIAPLPD